MGRSKFENSKIITKIQITSRFSSFDFFMRTSYQWILKNGWIVHGAPPFQRLMISPVGEYVFLHIFV
jgi:hypothetical protein